MSDQTHVEAPSEAQVSGWAVGFALFAGCMMALVGAFQAFQGLAAVLRNEFFVATPNFVFSFDVTAWGWIHLLLGIVIVFAGVGVMNGQPWARAVGISLAMLNAITQFLFLPHYPLWSVLMIAVDVMVIWALTVYGREAAQTDAS